MPDPAAVSLARAFWDLMATTDFGAVGRALSPTWPEPFPAPADRAHLVERA